jgi:mannose-1-phosphate guanylyltransferase
MTTHRSGVSPLHIVIRAGGKGTRLWPISTSKQPKQFQPIIRGKSTFALTLERVRPLLQSGSSLYVSTSEEFLQETKRQIDGHRGAHLIIEPFRKDTAGAVGLEAVYVSKQDPQGIIASLGSDHMITNKKEFQRLLRVARDFINTHPEYLLEIGVKPTYPETGYGYIQFGEPLETIKAEHVYRVKRFEEKPPAATAQKYVDAGDYLWNANMFVWRADTILSLYQQFQPEMYGRLMKIYDAIGTSSEAKVLKREYAKIEKIAVDYAIIEKAPKMAAISADIGWTDIGSFLALRDLLTTGDENLVQDVVHISLDSKRNVVYGDKKKIIATIGLENMAVIERNDVLLVCPLERVQEIKQLVDLFEEKKLKEFI